eukprot:CAMPEP_0198287504 /NCGR_PEP_ID=MMETSP1449-20131203/6289_1 /TAXON_ID=420275 /ORGANISM="Attheya septentrionalis, Strain CCMP2084" /LENGTH=435 /DNA_ID=CAMNT_0043985463 /DNA_START=272 /DNA_END=1579 /DNA_ORIENTATION=-
MPRSSTRNVGGYKNMNHQQQARAMQKVRSPNPQDVLCGRGGGINSHPGNKTFREWVKLEKGAYNSALTKSEKAKHTQFIVQKVKSLNPPGRFLQRDTTATSARPSLSSGSGANGLVGPWVEIDDIKALAKTSQALREGAPSIRAAKSNNMAKAHAAEAETDTDTDSKSSTTISHEETASDTVLAPRPLGTVENATTSPSGTQITPIETVSESMVAAAATLGSGSIIDASINVRSMFDPPQVNSTISNKRMSLGQEHLNGNKRQKAGQHTTFLPHELPFHDTPPPVTPQLMPISPEGMHSLLPPALLLPMPKQNCLARGNSLALSDISGHIDHLSYPDPEDFNDPFANDEEMLASFGFLNQSQKNQDKDHVEETLKTPIPTTINQSVMVETVLSPPNLPKVSSNYVRSKSVGSFSVASFGEFLAKPEMFDYENPST